MKKILMYIICLSLVLVFLPAAVVGGWWHWEEEAGKEDTADPVETPMLGNIMLKIFRSSLNEIVEMELEEYIEGVVSAEMPASFHLEALKAQAVVARTYALHKANAGGKGGCQSHPGADLCTESICCQAWESEEDALGKWPSQEAAYFLERIREAVSSTRGRIAVYEDNPISAVYHSTCGGKTEDAPEAWSGGAFSPYLQSVECGYCRHSPYYETEVALDLTAYVAALNKEKEALPVLADGKVPLLEILRRSPSGRNLLIRVGKPGPVYSGNELRDLLGLPSTWFEWQVEGEKIVFSSKGHGHGVGLCQFGADGLAREGKNYEDIIKHYYLGVETEIYRPPSGGEDEDARSQGSQAFHDPAVTAPDVVDTPNF